MRLGEAVLLAACTAAALVWVASPASLAYWQGRAPGSSFLPFWIGLATLATVALLVGGRIRGWLRGDRAEAAAGGRRKPAVVILALLLAVALVEPLGFVVATVLFAVVLAGVVERRSLAETGGVAAATGGIAVLFHHGLGVSLPAGPFGF